MEIITCNNNEIEINSYIIKENEHAIVIDPNNFEEIEKVLNNCKLDYILLTHEHFDHIMAVDKLRKKYNAKVIAQKYTSVNIQKSSKNLSKFSNIILDFMNKKTITPIEEFSIKAVDIIYDNSYKLLWQNLELNFFYTPGHSKGSSCILVQNYVFSGDSLFECCETDTRGIGCSKKDYQNITIPFFKTLNPRTKVFSGHYEAFILENKIEGKEKAIEIFKNRPKISNCYVDYNDFILLIETSTFFVRDNSIFILREEKDANFFKFYFFVNNYEELNHLDSFFSKFTKEIIIEYVSKNNINNNTFNNISFKHYKRYSRYINTNKKQLFYDNVINAKVEDISKIKELVNEVFDPLSDHIPTIEEIKEFIKRDELYIIKINNEIAGASIFQKEGVSYQFRLLCVNKNFRNRSIAKMLSLNSPINVKIFTAWIDDKNIASININQKIGFRKDGLKNDIFKYEKHN